MQPFEEGGGIEDMFFLDPRSWNRLEMEGVPESYAIGNGSFIWDTLVIYIIAFWLPWLSLNTLPLYHIPYRLNPKTEPCIKLDMLVVCTPFGQKNLIKVLANEALDTFLPMVPLVGTALAHWTSRRDAAMKCDENEPHTEAHSTAGVPAAHMLQFVRKSNHKTNSWSCAGSTSW